MTKIDTKFDFKCTEGFKKIYSGFSGGADSTALLIGLAKEARNTGFELEAIHFEHGIRGDESRADADWCREFCEIRKIPFRQIELEIDPDCKNLEATARKLRLEAWREIVDPEIEAVAVGQHADDRIENIFLRMMRGSNATGLTSMRSSQKVAGITFIRPMIGLRRVEIEEFLQESSVGDWRIDHTNFENIYRRNFIRNEVLPLIRTEFADADKAMLKSIAALEADADFLEKQALIVYSEIKDQIENINNIPLVLIEKIHSAIQARVLRLWFTEVIGTETIPTSDFLKRFNTTLAEYNNGDGRKILIPLEKDIYIALEKEKLSIGNSDSLGSLYHTVEWDYKEQQSIEWENFVFSCLDVSRIDDEELRDQSHNAVFFDARQLPDKLIIRKRIPGDRMVPFSQDNEVKIKKLLQNKDLRSDDKKNIPIVATRDGDIIWIPGVRRANFANISDLTIDIMCLSYKTRVS